MTVPSRFRPLNAPFSFFSGNGAMVPSTSSLAWDVVRPSDEATVADLEGGGGIARLDDGCAADLSAVFKANVLTSSDVIPSAFQRTTGSHENICPCESAWFATKYQGKLPSKRRLIRV